jgi:hypothetical protein
MIAQTRSSSARWLAASVLIAVAVTGIALRRPQRPRQSQPRSPSSAARIRYGRHLPPPRWALRPDGARGDDPLRSLFAALEETNPPAPEAAREAFARSAGLDAAARATLEACADGFAAALVDVAGNLDSAIGQAKGEAAEARGLLLEQAAEAYHRSLQELAVLRRSDSPPVEPMLAAQIPASARDQLRRLARDLSP